MASGIFCPCCGYPTLGERGGYEICELCKWEDDGQDDPHADEVWGGPNGRYSLAEARQNFTTYGSMYYPNKDTRLIKQDSPKTQDAKRRIIETCEAMFQEGDEHRIQAYWRIIQDNERILAEELRRSIHTQAQSAPPSSSRSND